jgi:hypothetical protein
MSKRCTVSDVNFEFEQPRKPKRRRRNCNIKAMDNVQKSNLIVQYVIVTKA